MFKRKIAFVVVIFMLFSGCSYSAYKDYYRDSESYQNIWELSGFDHGYDGVSDFFPESLDTLDVVDYYCRYDQQLPLGEGIQLVVEVRYGDEKQLQDEENRLALLGFSCDEYFEGTNLSAYATRLGDNGASEYALIDHVNQTVRYIYIQNLPAEEIEFDHQFLPDGYTGYGEVP